MDSKHYFTLEEATSLFGKAIRFTNTKYMAIPGHENKYPEFEAGDLAKVYSIVNEHEGIMLCIMIDDNDLREFRKDEFDSYCEVLKLEAEVHYTGGVNGIESSQTVSL